MNQGIKRRSTSNRAVVASPRAALLISWLCRLTYGQLSEGRVAGVPDERGTKLRDIQVSAVPPNKQLQQTVLDKVPSHIGQRAVAELRR
jgi:hypothetical protein